MDYIFQPNSKYSIEEFIKSLLMQASLVPDDDIRRLIMRFFALFNKSGIDYYELLALYSSFNNYTEDNLKEFLVFAPKPMSVLSASKDNIRRAIPRWTASRYHSDAIESVMEDIQRRILCETSGIFCYNSNLNPKSSRSLNDLYILIISRSEIRWFDINRKCTYQFLLGGMESAKISNS